MAKEINKGEEQLNQDNNLIQNLVERMNAYEQEIKMLRAEKVRHVDNIWTNAQLPTGKKSCLIPGKKIQILPINKGATNFISDPDQATMLRGAGKSLRLPIDKTTGNYVDPLTPEEKEYLEDVLGVNLNIFSKDNLGYNNSFYSDKKAVLKFKKKGFKLITATITLDLGKPYDYLLYKIALANSRVAKTWADRINPNFDFVIKDEGSELAEEMALNKKEDVVIKYLYSIENNHKALYDLIRLYGIHGTKGVKVNKTSSSEWLYNELKKVTKTAKGIRDLYNIISTIESTPTKLFDMVLIQDALECGILQRNGLEVRLRGGEIIAHSLEDAISYLNQLENKNTKLRVSQEVEKFLNNK
jgi:hypothetical protein